MDCCSYGAPVEPVGAAELFSRAQTVPYLFTLAAGETTQLGEPKPSGSGGHGGNQGGQGAGAGSYQTEGKDNMGEADM